MAGDWLKVEITTPGKPEVSNIAHRLGITPEEAFGRLFLVWAWCQNVSANGHVRVRDLSPIDRAAGIPGFGQAMAEERWVEPAKDGFAIPKWDRHLSKGAKKRALDAERKARSRHENVPKDSASKADNARTRVREEKNSPSLRSGETAQRAARLPPDWTLPKAWGEWALKDQPTWDAAHARRVADSFRDWWIAKAGKDGAKLDWEATWRNWVRREGPRKVNGKVVDMKPWRAGAEPIEVLERAARELQLSPWGKGEFEGETHGQFRTRIVDAGGEAMLKPGVAA